MAGFSTALATVALSGIGDKTFLTAIALATRHRARWVFTGSVSALTIGAGIWIATGAWLQTFVAIETIQLRAGITFLIFGVNALLNALKLHKSNLQANYIEKKNRNIALPANAVIRNSFTTTFLAEFGDKTQFALLGLAAVPNLSAMSIFSGAVAANILLAVIAVTAGNYLKKMICQKKLTFFGGILFIVLG
ncbi:MAG: TMEM165/GDT1 family protein [Synechococcales cyanobacterium H12SWP_bin.12]|nr:TMEM165/GDT1 family protein [Synechococcales cyanobacterium H12SWP_bin.12]